MCDFCSEPKSAKSQEISVVSFSKLLHISSTAATVLENGGSAASVLRARSFTLVTCVLLLKFKGDLLFFCRARVRFCALYGEMLTLIRPRAALLGARARAR